MYIIVVGAGKVGFYLTRALISEGQEVVVIEKDPVKADRITTALGGTAITGDGAEVSTLELAGAARANVVAAVTGDDEDNLVIAQVAKARFNVPRTIARINNPKNEFIFTKLGIDATVSATQAVLSLIQQEIPQHPFVHLLTLQDGEVEFVELHLTEDAPAVGTRPADLALPPHSTIAVVIRDGVPLNAADVDVLRAGDRLVAVTTVGQETALGQAVLGELQPV